MAKTVRLTVVSTEAEAEVVCGLLRAEEIACFHRPTDFSAEGLGLGGQEWREIAVGESDLVQARELLAAVEPLHAQCIKCGRPIGDDGRWYSEDSGELAP